MASWVAARTVWSRDHEPTPPALRALQSPVPRYTIVIPEEEILSYLIERERERLFLARHDIPSS